MNPSYRSILEWIDTQSQPMCELVTGWARINSHSFNFNGLDRLRRDLSDAFQPLGETIESVGLEPMEYIAADGKMQIKPLGGALKICRRPGAKKQVLLVCHFDTVYPSDQPEHHITRQGHNLLKGPGVTDAKGGIAVLLKSLEAFERSPVKEGLGWTVFLNPDEEIGSPGSRAVLSQLAPRFQMGLVYEPCLANGDLVGDRKGSGNFSLVVRGQAAHAGRDPQKGRNAIDVLARCISKINSLKGSRPGLTVNVGMIEGGRALNIVPDIAIARFNVRIEKPEDEAHVWVDLKHMLHEFEGDEGISLEIHGGFFAPPKILHGKTLGLYQALQDCGKDLGMDLHWQSSGGVCDGNRLAAYGLPNVDTLGVQGGDIHSAGEYLNVESLAQRAKLSALLLMKVAAGEIEISMF